MNSHLFPNKSASYLGGLHNVAPNNCGRTVVSKDEGGRLGDWPPAEGVHSLQYYHGSN